MQVVEYAVIAGAGLGSRLGTGRPKCLLEVAGRTLLEGQLEVLESVPEVRLVVGYREVEVIALARRLRPSIIIVRNPDFRTTTTLHSLALATAGIPGPTLVMDADLVLDGQEIAALLHEEVAPHDPLVCYTETKTVDAVHVDVVGDRITGFSRERATPWEWANVAVVPAAYLSAGGSAVFERLSEDLPLRCRRIDSIEVDRPEDLHMAEERLRRGLVMV